MFVTDDLLAADGVAHGFFGRCGGVSGGIYDSLNCGFGTRDDMAAVRQNRGRVVETLGTAGKLLTLWQHHSADCLTVTEAWPTGRGEDLPKLDAMVTNKPGFVLGILTADCAPVLFSGTDGQGAPVIGAAHAGWKGALCGVLENTVEAMRALGAERISAAIGPCIGQESYEVSAEFMAPFLAQEPGNEIFFAAGKNDTVRQFDLPGYVARRLKQAGVEQVSYGGADTYARESDYFSYRRATHREEPDYGRQVSIISIRP